MFESDQILDEKKASGPLGQMIEMDHEQVVFCNDPSVGLKAIIAVHNTVLGPSLGGTRMWNYASEAEALTDVLRLSRGMTYKAAISGLNLGGGKAVIIGDSRTQKTEALMRRFGQFVNSLNGKYITAEDVGITTRDIEYASQETKHLAGLPESLGGGGDPSPVTAYGVYMGIKAAAKKVWGSDGLNGRSVLVQGVGNVGYYLVGYLVKEGAEVMISDIFDDRIASVTKEYNSVKVVHPEVVYDCEMDIYAPCALGATLNDETLPKLKCRIIAGGANNQLADERKHSYDILENGIIYAPDFLINAGGIINCYSEVIGYNRDDAYRKTENIFDVTYKVLEESSLKNIPAHTVALNMAKARIESIKNIKSSL